MSTGFGKSVWERIESTQHSRILPWLILAQALLFLTIGLNRFVDGDEGHFLLASKLVFAGRALYSDFLYLQMPLLPYVYGAWMQVFGLSWISARVLSVLFAIGIGLLLYTCVVCARRSKASAILAVLLYTTSSLTFGWFTVVKTQALSTFLLFGAYTALCHMSRAGLKAQHISSGMLFGLAVDSRLFFCALIPVFMLGLRRNGVGKPTSAKVQIWLWFALGVLIAMLPNLYFVLTDWTNYYFGNIGHHSMRNPAGLIGDINQKLRTLLGLIGIGDVRGIISLQVALLLILNIRSYIRHRSTGQKLPLALYMWLLLSCINLLPTPTFFQYFSVCIPFAVLSAVLGIGDNGLAILRGSKRSPTERWRSLDLIIPLLFVLVSPLGMYRYTISGVDVPGLIPQKEVVNWKIPVIRQVSQAIDQYNPERESVMSSWPGYLFETESEIAPGMENQFGIVAGLQLPEEARRRHHLIAVPEVFRLLKESSIVVLGIWNYDIPDDQMLSWGYQLVSSVSDTRIYVRKH